MDHLFPQKTPNSKYALVIYLDLYILCSISGEIKKIFATWLVVNLLQVVGLCLAILSPQGDPS